MRLVGGSDITDDQGRDLLLKKAATVANLPTQGESDGDIYLVLDEDTIYQWDLPSLSWVVPATNGLTSTSLKA